jgi:hypothetical protein
MLIAKPNASVTGILAIATPVVTPSVKCAMYQKTDLPLIFAASVLQTLQDFVGTIATEEMLVE